MPRVFHIESESIWTDVVASIAIAAGFQYIEAGQARLRLPLKIGTGITPIPELRSKYVLAEAGLIGWGGEMQTQAGSRWAVVTWVWARSVMHNKRLMLHLVLALHWYRLPDRP